ITLSDCMSVALNTGLGELERSSVPRSPVSRRTQRMLTRALGRINAGGRPVDLGGLPWVRLPAFAAALPELGQAPAAAGDWRAANERFNGQMSQLDSRLKQPVTSWAQLIETARLLDAARAEHAAMSAIEGPTQKFVGQSRQNSLGRATTRVRRSIDKLRFSGELIPALQAAATNSDAQMALLEEVYTGLTRGPLNACLQAHLTLEDLQKRTVFLPDEVYRVASKYMYPGYEHSEAMASKDAILVRDRVAEPADPATVTHYTPQMIIAHEIDHMLSRRVNPEFFDRAWQMAESTGFNLEEGIPTLIAWRHFGAHRELANGPGAFGYAASLDQTVSDSGGRPTGLDVDVPYTPETIATEYLYRLAGEEIMNRARYEGDRDAMNLVFQLAAGPVARFFDNVKEAIDRDANVASTPGANAEGNNSEDARTERRRGIRRLFKFGAGTVAFAVATPTLVRLGMHGPTDLHSLFRYGQDAMAAGGWPMLVKRRGKRGELREPPGKVVTLAQTPVRIGVDPSGQPLAPTTRGYDSWADVARHARALVKGHLLANRTGGSSGALLAPLSADEGALFAFLTQRPESGTHFVVSDRTPV